MNICFFHLDNIIRKIGEFKQNHVYFASKQNLRPPIITL